MCTADNGVGNPVSEEVLLTVLCKYFAIIKLCKTEEVLGNPVVIEFLYKSFPNSIFIIHRHHLSVFFLVYLK